jgi:YidC/Oxa1 family membrane protein insertase
MDRSSSIGYIVILFLFIGFYYFNSKNKEELDAQERKVEQMRADSLASLAENQVSIDEASVSETETTEVQDSFTPLVESKATLSNELLSIDFSSIGGKPNKVNLTEFHKYDSSDLVLFDGKQMRLNYAIPLANGAVINTESQSFKLEESENQIVMTLDLPNNASIVKTYTLESNSYKLDYNVTFNNIGSVVAPNNRFAELAWSTDIQGQEKTLKDERAATTIYYRYGTDDEVDYLSETSSDDDELHANVQWVSFKQKFFNQTLINNGQFIETGTKIEIIEPEDENVDYVKKAQAQFYIPLDKNTVEESMAFYYGPNHYPTLKNQGIELHKIIPLGWGIFGWVNKLIVIPIFNWLNNYLSNFGLIILLLTLIIKTALFPFMYKTYKSTAKMRILKPELDEIKERVGDDMQKAQQEQMKLYKQAGVSPLGGCLPQLVQMPILFAMFRFFPSSIELRQESLWWADDLSTYDSVFDFPNGFEIPFYGDHVSLFTLMMTTVTLLYTYMNSQNSGQMVGPMKTVMYLMPVMFLGFFNNYAAALSFYYFLSTCMTIIQNFIIRKFVIDEDKLHKQIQDSKKKKVKVKKSGLQKRLEDMAKKRGIDPKTGKPSSGSKPKRTKKKK